MEGTVAEKIDEMVRRIVDGFDPEWIILYGSQARGDAGPDSDVDLLVVTPVEGSRWKKGGEMRRAVEDVHVAKDIIVVTPEEVERHRNISGTMVRPAMREGKLMYARPGKGPPPELLERPFSVEDGSMRGEVLAVVRGWVRKAEGDLRAAEFFLAMRENPYPGTICLHANECVEKYLKAFLVLRGIDFPKSHNVAEILTFLPEDARPSLTREEQEKFALYAMTIDYPFIVSPTQTEAREAIAVARRVREAMRALFPKDAMEERED